jgi:signal transduction histidine kinase
LRTPLTAIRVRVEALHDGLVTGPENVERYYKAIRADVIALGILIDDLFELAQLDAGGPALEMMPSSLADLISDCLESFQPLAGQHQVNLVGEVARAVDPVLMNPGKIGRVLGNLVENALGHSPPGGLVTIRAARGEDAVTVSVEDSGPGFEGNDLTHIFEQFFRGEAARSRESGHAGLGLAIARGIIEAHGGRIWAENRPGGGARVSFSLPQSP